MSDFLFLAPLGLSAFSDARRRSVPLWQLVLLAAGAAAAFLLAPEKRLTGLMFSAFIGLVFALGKGLRTQAGAADFAALAACGPGLCFRACTVGLLISGLLTGLWALILLGRSHSKKEEIPFLPFLFTGMLAGTVSVLCLKH